MSRTYIRFRAHPQNSSLAVPIVNHRERTDSNRSWQQVESWIEVCDRDHDACVITTTPYTPGRVLDLSPENESEVRLLLTPRNTSVPLKYATLSHCWGTQKIFTLTRENLEACQKSIPVDELPQTFLDTIAATRRLGIRYLWIDSLCIIQNDIGDWRHAASHMHEIYEHAFLNIAATGAFHGKDGLFFRREATHIDPIPILLDWGLPESRPYVMVQDMLYVEKYQFMSEPLMLRAWVLQERLLSTRVIHFARQQIFWTCKRMRASESHPNGESDFGVRSLVALRRSPAFRWEYAGSRRSSEDQSALASSSSSTSSLVSISSSSTHPSEFWHWIVEQYSRCKLTKSGDKLVALAGIAAKMRTFAGHQLGGYMAGLWEKTLPEDLLWRSVPVYQKPATYRAPSWSWASEDNNVSWDHERKIQVNVKYYIDVQDVHIANIRETAFGEVQYGALFARCQLMKYHSSIKDSSRFLKVIYDSPSTVEKEYDGFLLLIKSAEFPFVEMNLDTAVAHWGIIVDLLPSEDNAMSDAPTFQRIGYYYSAFSYFGSIEAYEHTIHEANKTISGFESVDIVLI